MGVDGCVSAGGGVAGWQMVWLTQAPESKRQQSGQQNEYFERKILIFCALQFFKN